MLNVKSFINNPTPSNTYLLYSEDQNGCVIIDPGSFFSPELYDFIATNHLIPDFIILTHEHFDHSIGVIKLKELFPSLKVICSELCSSHIQSPKWNLTAYSEKIKPVCILGADFFVEDINYSIKWNDYIFHFIITQGHSMGSICIQVDHLLFSGDTLMKGVFPVTKLKGGNKQIMLETLIMMRKSFANNIYVYPGHGLPFYLEEEYTEIENYIRQLKKVC